MDEELEEEDDIEEEKEAEESETEKKGLVNCIGKKSAPKNKGIVQERKRERKQGTVRFPDAMYNAIDSNVNMDHKNGLANSTSVSGKNDHQNYEKTDYLTQLETIV